MKNYQLNCHRYSFTLCLKVYAGEKARLRMVGFDSNKPNTKYFDTGYGSKKEPFKGTETFYINCPMSPPVMHVNVYNAFNGSDKNVILKDLWVERLEPDEQDMTDYTRGFINHLLWFAENAGSLPAREEPYESEDGKYLIVYSDYLTVNGQKLDSPARIGHETGVVEFAASYIRNLSIPIRVQIGLHEWMHHARDTRQEEKADKVAIKYYKAMKFPDVEAIYAFTEVFNSKGDEQKQKAIEDRAKKILNEVK